MVYRVHGDITCDSNIMCSLNAHSNLDHIEYQGLIEISSPGTIFQKCQGGKLVNQLVEILTINPGFESLILDSYSTLIMECNKDPGQLIFIHKPSILNEFDKNGKTRDSLVMLVLNTSA